MDWFLSVITIIGNYGLGYLRGVWWSWFVCTIPAYVWIYYAISIGEYGLILASVVQATMYYFTGFKRLKHDTAHRS
jgi:hypothetical protein